MPVRVDGFLNFYFHVVQKLSPLQRFKRSLYKSAVQSVCRRKVEWIDQAENLSSSGTSLSFSRTSAGLSALAKFDSLKLTEKHC